MNPRIVVLSGPSQRSVFPVTESELDIGRDAANRICINDWLASRRHCTIRLENGHALLVDLDSRNGTYVNGFCFSTKILVHGDRIRAGSESFVYVDREEVDEKLLVWRDTGGVTFPTERAMAFQAARTVVLNAFLRINASINMVRSPDEIQARIFDLIFEIIPAERAAILLTGHDQLSFVAAAYRRIGSQDGEPFPIDEAIARQVLHDGVAVSGDESGIMCRPLTALDAKVGVIYVVGATIGVPSDSGARELLGSIAGLAAVALEHARYVEWIEGENRRLTEVVSSEHGMIGHSEKMKEVSQFIGKAGPSDRTVLILGASGTGKELAARAVHSNSPRSHKPFVAVNCGAFTETLLESELFGHEKGAFTGAVAQRNGLFAVADGGTLFLDEIGELPMPMQAALLRVLQDGEFKRLGGSRSIHTDVRIVAATNRDLDQAIEQGRFRQDLFFRLNVLEIRLPSLSERREDIPALVAHFIKKYGYIRSTSGMSPVCGMTPEAHRLLAAYAWPGNIRELEHAIERAISLGVTEYIRPEDLPRSLRAGNPETSSLDTLDTYDVEFDAFRKSLFEKTLQKVRGNRVEAARRLGLHPTYFYQLCRDLDVK